MHPPAPKMKAQYLAAAEADMKGDWTVSHVAPGRYPIREQSSTAR
jgi:protocatechuate 3,4-dioxygenase beta subunit